ncbi:hypothetical protein EDD11_005141 [Mortierella claussenii]|nr:hypothetical protein EDD11_005141 [Mortierella claussenii]
MYCIRAFLPLLLMPFPSTAPYFVIFYFFSLYRHHRPCVYCIFTVILLFSTTCYWGSDRCWVDLNNFHIFDPIRHQDGSPTSTFGLQLPAFVNKLDDYIEGLLTFLGGGEPLAKVVRVGSDFAKTATTSGATTAYTAAATATRAGAEALGSSATAANEAASTSLESVADAVAAVLLSAAGANVIA